MHMDLSPHLHTKECNELIEQMQNCFTNNRFKKFLFACDKLEIKAEQCLRRERLARQKLHNETAIKKREELHQRLRDQAAAEREKQAKI